MRKSRSVPCKSSKMFKNSRSRRGRGAAAYCRRPAFQARDRAGKHGARLVVRAEVIGDALVEEGVREQGDQLDSAVDIIEGRIDEPERVKAHHSQCSEQRLAKLLRQTVHDCWTRLQRRTEAETHFETKQLRTAGLEQFA